MQKTNDSRLRTGVTPPDGFSLLELLVVIAVLTLLGGLLLPALLHAQRAARAAHCKSNLRQVGLAQTLYADEYGAFPLAIGENGLGNWQRVLRPYANRQVLTCPQRVRVAGEYREMFQLKVAKIEPQYGYNYRGAARRMREDLHLGLGGGFDPELGRIRPTAASSVRVPAEMIAAGDSNAVLFFPLLLAHSRDYTDLVHLLFPRSTGSVSGVGWWHGGGANILFCDGHVEFGERTEWTEPTDRARRRWNKDHLPHPELW